MKGIIHQGELRMLKSHFRQVLESHDAGNGVAGIPVQTTVPVPDAGIESPEIVVPDDDFAACGKGNARQGKKIAAGVFQFNENGFVGNVLSGLTVAAGGENAVFPDGGNPVVFRLNQKAFLRAPGVFPGPLHDFVQRIGLVQRKHGLRVADLPVPSNQRRLHTQEQGMPGIECG